MYVTLGMSPTWQGLSGKTTYVLRIAKFYQAKLRIEMRLENNLSLTSVVASIQVTSANFCPHWVTEK